MFFLTVHTHFLVGKIRWITATSSPRTAERPLPNPDHPQITEQEPHWSVGGEIQGEIEPSRPKRTGLAAGATGSFRAGSVARLSSSLPGCHPGFAVCCLERWTRAGTERRRRTLLIFLRRCQMWGEDMQVARCLCNHPSEKPLSVPIARPSRNRRWTLATLCWGWEGQDHRAGLAVGPGNNSPGPGLRMKDEGQWRCDYRFYQMCCFCLNRSESGVCTHARACVCVWFGGGSGLSFC